MSLAKVIEVTASSSESFEKAIRDGIRRASKTIQDIQGAWINEQSVVVEDGKVTEFRVNMKVTFLLKE